MKIEWVKIECEDAGTYLDFTVDGKTSYGSCLKIHLASRPGMSFQVPTYLPTYRYIVPVPTKYLNRYQ